jgi:hypothetical protein
MKLHVDWKKEIPWNKYKWAKYACLSKNGTLKLFRDKPLCENTKGFWWFSKTYPTKSEDYEIEVVLGDYNFKGDWTETLITRPKVKE